MFTQQDYVNLAALLARVRFDGINEAMVGVQLFDKLQKASAPPQVEEPKKTDGDGTVNS